MLPRMCGRYTLAITYEELAEELGVEPDPAIAEAYRPRYNLAPTEGSLVLREHEGHGELMPARFGLVNFWAKDLSAAARQINARAETVREKPAFREAFQRRRCIVPADGFYEWKPEGRGKQPYWFHPSEGKLLRFAGLYETWKDRETGAQLRTFAIITTAANDVVGPVHDRMPVILKPDDAHTWLSASPDEAFALLQPAPNRMLVAQRASKRVGNVRNDDPGLLQPDEPAQPEPMPLFQKSR
jgi:putative SOS response-associated peptidase YedK